MIAARKAGGHPCEKMGSSQPGRSEETGMCFAAMWRCNVNAGRSMWAIDHRPALIAKSFAEPMRHGVTMAIANPVLGLRAIWAPVRD